MKFKVLIRQNDLRKTHVSTIKADLRPAQAEKITNELNAAFASQGLQWFAVAEPEDDE